MMSDRDSNRLQEAFRDAELVRRFKEGDQSALVEIASLYQRRVFLVALSVLRRRSDAEKVTRATFLRAGRGLAGFQGDCSLASWLYRIAVNLSRSSLRHLWWRRVTIVLNRVFHNLREGNFRTLFSVNGLTRPQGAATDEFTSLVATCMDRLAPRQSEILMLRSLLDHSYFEIAEVLGVDVGAVKGRISRARANLRSQLIKACRRLSPSAAPGEWLEHTSTPQPIGFACR